MPYIDKEKKEAINKEIGELSNAIKNIPDFEKNRAGIFNYVITKLAIACITDKTNYASMNDIIGALEACKLEFYRRLVSHYEDIKIRSNGDVYPEFPWMTK
jgi:hypothetical protein